jgi:hypothetical protein
VADTDDDAPDPTSLFPSPFPTLEASLLPFKDRDAASATDPMAGNDDDNETEGLVCVDA